MPTALSTDLYELTMAAGYYAHGESGRASFELSIRDLPAERSYLVAAGLDQALKYLENLHFKSSEIEYLRTVPALAKAPREFFDKHLPHLRFTGDVWAIPEGTPVFAQEPLLRVTAPLLEAQIVETGLLATMLFQVLIASKAARIVQAAHGRPVIEFGARRAHGTEAGCLAGRAAFIGGCAGTSDVEAGFQFGIPVSGTMAHSWVMTHRTEDEAFLRYSDIYGDEAVLLIDTYDTVEAAKRIVRAGLMPAAVRLDSGDLASLSRAVRSILNDGGLQATKIFASGDLDEFGVARLVDSGAPIDAFGVGTALSTSKDVPALSGTYKLVERELDGRSVPTIKLSVGKRTYPGRKQVWRTMAGETAESDLLATANEPSPPCGEALLMCVMRNGRRLVKSPTLREIQVRCLKLVKTLPSSVRRLESPEKYSVTISPTLRALQQSLAEALA